MDPREIESLDQAHAVLSQMALALLSGDPDLQQVIVPARPKEEAKSRITEARSAMIILDAEGLIVGFNEEAERIFGVSQRDVVGKDTSIVLSTSDGGPPITLSDPAIAWRRSLAIAPSVLGRRQSGATFPLDIQGGEMSILGQQLFFLQVQNLAEKLRAEEPIRRAEARYRALVEQIPAVTFLAALDEGHNEMYVSPQIEALLGFSQQEWLDDPVLWFKRLHPDDQDLWNEEFARGVATGGPFRAECRVIARDGHVVWIHGEARLVRDDAGRPLMLQGMAFDITESKRAAQQIREAQEAKVRNERLAAIGQFAAGIGHDIRNPLAAIRNAFHYVKRRLDGTELGADARIAQILGIVEKEVNTCTKIVGDLLDYARERPPRFEMCPLEPLVADAITGVAAPAHVAIVNEVPAALPLCDLDRAQFRQVMVNLIQNAAEAIPEDRAGIVRVTAKADDDRVEIAVGDNGVGIPAENREKIFEPLFTSKTHGTGLGLSIVGNVIARHGGTIAVQSSEASGTTFTVSLPRRATADKPRAKG